MSFAHVYEMRGGGREKEGGRVGRGGREGREGTLFRLRYSDQHYW